MGKSWKFWSRATTLCWLRLILLHFLFSQTISNLIPFCILSSCNCSSARQWHLSLHRKSFVSAWLVDLLGVYLYFHSKGHAVFRFTHFTRGHCGGLAAVTKTGLGLWNQISGSECVATGVAIASFCSWLSDVDAKQRVLIYFGIYILSSFPKGM